MMGSLAAVCLLSASLFLSWAPAAGHRGLQIGLCRVSVNLQEVRDSFNAIRKLIQSQDSSLSLRIIEKSSLQDVTPSQRCCLLRHLLRFYIERVFRHCEAAEVPLRRKISVLANSFLSIKRDLKLCHAELTCACGEESGLKYEIIQENFQTMDASTAVLKALGELDILLDWMERIH
ncbi:interleukin-20-like [Rhinatrema bivittatum]|uniref:interleukin-20-like n=1 Tax=Rhinatrema bivittatum TaxID=194408 RepID=UPI001129E831|nr:interleukin-20-like [Rhinatrema bivittatum]